MIRGNVKLVVPEEKFVVCVKNPFPLPKIQPGLRVRGGSRQKIYDRITIIRIKCIRSLSFFCSRSAFIAEKSARFAGRNNTIKAILSISRFLAIGIRMDNRP
jgi:hypothetical protein